jgi:TonB family protein
MDSATSPAYLWQVPAKPVSISLNLDVVDRLGVTVKEGFKSLPRRGLETGGLLLGSEKRKGDGIVVEVTGFEPLECEHAFGPSYLLSAADRKVLEERMAWHKSRRGPAVVGFYRSHTRKEFALTVEDVDLMSEWFSRESNVFLLLQSNGELPPTAGFAIWEGRKIRSNVPYRTFEFARAALEAGGAILPGAPAPPAKRFDPPPQPGPVHRTTSPAQWLPKIPAHVDWAWIVAAAIVTMTLLLAAVVRRDPGRPVAPVPLGLDVRHDGAALRLLWNRNASVVQTATRAVLWIGDGGGQEKLELDPTQLAGGSILYWPRTSDVNFRMEVFSPASHGSESLRAVGDPAPPPQPVTFPALPAAPAPPAQSPVSVAARRPLSTADRAIERKFVEAEPVKRPPAAAVRAPSAPIVAAIPKALPLPVLPTPRPALPAPLRREPPPPSPPLIAAERAPDFEDPPVRVETDLLPDTPKPGLWSRLHLAGRRSDRPGFVPPQPVHRPALAIPPNLRARARREGPIDVRVYVDPSGRVEYAELETEADQTDRDLAALAVFSSRRWQFVPAHIGDRKVAGEVVLRYRFPGF